jgi:pyridoxine kinase
MAHILSLQSHVAYGYVGNCVATFVLQRMGHEVIRVNTVQFSSHSGYGKLYGDIMSLEHIEKIFLGLQEYNFLNDIQAVVTGYMGDKSLGDVLVKWLSQIRQINPNLIYCCDPVIGDIDRGVYVKDGVGDFFKQNAARLSNIMTPNHFELSYLTGINCDNIVSVIDACNILHKQGVGIVLVTSLLLPQDNPNEISMLISSSSKGVFKISTPKLQMPIAVTGAGDMTSAIFLSSYLNTRDEKLSLELTTTKVFSIFEKTLEAKRRELALVQEQNCLSSNDVKFIAHKIDFFHNLKYE